MSRGEHFESDVHTVSKKRVRRPGRFPAWWLARGASWPSWRRGNISSFEPGFPPGVAQLGWHASCVSASPGHSLDWVAGPTSYGGWPAQLPSRGGEVKASARFRHSSFCKRATSLCSMMLGQPEHDRAKRQAMPSCLQQLLASSAEEGELLDCSFACAKEMGAATRCVAHVGWVEYCLDAPPSGVRLVRASEGGAFALGGAMGGLGGGHRESGLARRGVLAYRLKIGVRTSS